MRKKTKRRIIIVSIVLTVLISLIATWQLGFLPFQVAGQPCNPDYSEYGRCRCSSMPEHIICFVKCNPSTNKWEDFTQRFVCDYGYQCVEYAASSLVWTTKYGEDAYYYYYLTGAKCGTPTTTTTIEPTTIPTTTVKPTTTTVKPTTTTTRPTTTTTPTTVPTTIPTTIGPTTIPETTTTVTTTSVPTTTTTIPEDQVDEKIILGVVVVLIVILVVVLFGLKIIKL